MVLFVVIMSRHLFLQVIDYRKNELEEQMLTNLYKKTYLGAQITNPNLMR